MFHEMTFTDQVNFGAGYFASDALVLAVTLNINFLFFGFSLVCRKETCVANNHRHLSGHDVTFDYHNHHSHSQEK